MEQEAQYQLEMSKAMARLRGIESMISTVANAGNEWVYIVRYVWLLYSVLLCI